MIDYPHLIWFLHVVGFSADWWVAEVYTPRTVIYLHKKYQRKTQIDTC